MAQISSSRAANGAWCESPHSDIGSRLVDLRFKYALDKRFAPFIIPFALQTSKHGVIISGDGDFRATFGFVKLTTSLANIDEAHITRDYRWWKAIGARRSFADDGLTFGTNCDAGVCVHFHEPVPSLLGPSGHSALTVTVEDLEGLTDAVSP